MSILRGFAEMSEDECQQIIVSTVRTACLVMKNSVEPSAS